MACIQDKDAYALINAKGGTCMDLSGGDNRSIIGYEYHGGPNQIWIFELVGCAEERTFCLKSSGSDQYLAVEGVPHDGIDVVASRFPCEWHVEDEPGIYDGVRLLPATNPGFCVDLLDHGSSVPGTPVGLWGRWEGLNQVWKLKRPN